MADTQTDRARQEPAGEPKPARRTLLGQYFTRNAGRPDAAPLQTAASLKPARRVPRTRAMREGSLPRARVKLAACDSSQEPGSGRQKVMMALIPILALVLLYLSKNPLMRSSPAQAQEEPPVEVAPVAISDVELTWAIPPLYQPNGRDPMRRPAPSVPVAEVPAPEPLRQYASFVVTGILHSEDRPVAIVDTILVHEGKQVFGATVVKIEKDAVQFEMNGRTWRQAVEANK
ncbi:MAG TPA: hypothetical protein VLI39_04680 [Sedimentisphaerales bacterium]|nr:hypothetical protein [Sedimentisphaerales bacterium]